MTKGVKLTKAKMTKMSTLAMLARAKKNSVVKKKAKRPAGAMMGPVSTISTAPLAIGNSVRGAKNISRRTPGGVVVAGRDFMFTPVGSGSIQTWTMVGGTPITPVAFADSVVRQYLQMYQKYRWRRCVVHYITSSPTSATGDVMFYHGKNRDSVFLNQTSNFLLPFVISDPDTVIGPQWTNHSADLQLQGTWKSTDYGMGDALNDYADGEVFLLSKTATTDSPGYVLFDYEIEFAEQQISPRLLSLPLPRAQYSNLALQSSGGAKTQGLPAQFILGGNNISGAQSVLPALAAVGDIYKMIVDITNSTFTVGTAGNLIQGVLGQGEVVALSDGFTIYAVLDQSNTLELFPNSTAAYAGNTASAFDWGASLTYNVNVQVWISLVGTQSPTNWTPNF